MSEVVKDAPAFDFYPERWLAGVAALSDAEQLAYVRLLCHQWLTAPEQGLPDDLPALKRLGGKGVTATLLEKFPVGDDGRRRNARLEVVRLEQRERIAKARDKAKRMNEGRWKDKHKESIKTPQGFHVESPPLSTHHSPSFQSESAGAKNGGVDAEAIRQAYPRQTHQAAALQWITSSLDRGAEPEVMLQAVRECRAIIQSAEVKGPIRWVPNPESFFQNEIWLEPQRFAESLKPKTNGKPAQPSRLTPNPSQPW